jgi:hypothetical protein
MKTSLAHSKVLLVAAAIYQMTGCAPLAPTLDETFGNSVTALRNFQIINPAASDNTALTEQDARAANEATGRYYKSFNAPTPPQNVLTIGVSKGAQ